MKLPLSPGLPSLSTGVWSRNSPSSFEVERSARQARYLRPHTEQAAILLPCGLYAVARGREVEGFHIFIPKRARCGIFHWHFNHPLDAALWIESHDAASSVTAVPKITLCVHS